MIHRSNAGRAEQNAKGCAETNARSLQKYSCLFDGRGGILTTAGGDGEAA
jgi:hypothetical protein